MKLANIEKYAVYHVHTQLSFLNPERVSETLSGYYAPDKRRVKIEIVLNMPVYPNNSSINC
jgi:hypothetical protein